MAVCPVCKKTFVPSKMQRARLREGKKIYCSTECYLKRRTKSVADLDAIYDKCVEIISKFPSKKYREILMEKLEDVFPNIDFQELYTHVKGRRDKIDVVARAIVQTLCDMENIGVKIVLNESMELKAVRIIKNQLNLKILPDFKKIVHNQVDIACDTLNLPSEVRNELLKNVEDFVERAKAQNIYGSPLSIGAALIFFLLKSRGAKIQKKEVAAIFGINEATLRHKEMEIRKVVGTYLLPDLTDGVKML